MVYKSEIYEVIHQSAIEKFEIGAISETKMREYNEMCLLKESETAPDPDVCPEKKQSSPIAV